MIATDKNNQYVLFQISMDKEVGSWPMPVGQITLKISNLIMHLFIVREFIDNFFYFSRKLEP